MSGKMPLNKANTLGRQKAPPVICGVSPLPEVVGAKVH